MRASARRIALGCLLAGALTVTLTVEPAAEADSTTQSTSEVTERGAASAFDGPGQGVTTTRPPDVGGKRPPGEPRGLEDSAERPNVLVLFTDDMRRDELRFMPRTRRLIGDAGTTYERGLSENPLCCPFRAALLTGQYGHNSGVLTNEGEEGGFQALDLDRTMNRTLRKHGYTTAWVGKFLNGYPTDYTPSAQGYVPPGWDEWHVPVWGEYDYGATVLNRNGALRSYTEHRADLLGRVSSSVITRLARRPEPFYAAVSFLAPHVGTTPAGGWGAPRPAPRHRGSLLGRMGPLPASFDEEDVADKPGYIREHPRLTAAQARKMVLRRRARAEALRSVDEAVARQLEALRRTGELQDTIVVFTSDNGLLLGEHRLMEQKRVPYDESVEVPLLIRGPGFRPGATDRRQVGVVDLASTIAHATRIVPDLPHPVDGRDLRLGQHRTVLLETGSHLLDDWDTGARRAYVGVRTPRFLYVRYWNDEEELYDRVTDPAQLESVHADPRYRAHLARLRAETERLRDCAGAACWR